VVKTEIRGLPAAIAQDMPFGGTIPGSIKFIGIEGDIAVYEYVPPVPPARPTTEFDRKAAAWVRKHYPDAKPIVGTVEFGMDAAAFASSAWAHFDVAWSETVRYPLRDGGELPSGTKGVAKVISESAWQYDATELLRELVEMDDPGEEL
jgi:hypothetical protein